MHGGVPLLGELADLLRLERREVVRRRECRAPATAHSVTVKPSEWKNGTMPRIDVVAPQVNDLVDGFDVRADVVVGEHDALGLAGGAGGEDHRQLVVAAHAVQAEHAIDERSPASRRPARRRRACRPW